MIFFRKTAQAVTVLLMLLMSIILVLPSGMHLELCFGNDGHVDFSLSGCADGATSKIPASGRLPVYDTAHHDDCLPMAVACGTAQELIRANGKSDAYKSEPRKDHAKTPLLFSELLADSADAYLDPNIYPMPFEDFPSPRLVSLRTDVLLI
jgi:hypothetical protein